VDIYIEMASQSPNTIPATSYMQSNASDLSDIQEGQIQTITDISELQNIEKDYFSRLNLGLINDSLTPDEKDALVQKINEISQMRVNLYKNLNSTYQFYETNVSSTQNTLAEQSAAIDIVESELNNAKMLLKQIEEEKNNKLRLIEINNYYGEKFSDQSRIMKIIIAICVPILILSILANRGLIPNQIFLILVIAIPVVGGIFLLRVIYDSYMRNNMIYDEYDFTFDKSKAPPVDLNAASNAASSDNSNSNTCVGQMCCASNETYSPEINKCQPNPTTDSSLGSATV